MAATTGLGGTAASMGAGTYAKVILTVKSAHNMRDKAWMGKADPYCVIRLADAEIQTHHVKSAGESCTWDESFAFNNVSPGDVIEFSVSLGMGNVYDHNRLLKDAHMGEGSLSMRQVFEEGRMETRVLLTTRTGTKDAGEIWITLRKEGGEAGMGGAGTGAAGLATTTPTAGLGATSAGLGATSAGLGATSAGVGSQYGEERERGTTERTSGYGTAGTAAGTAGYGVTERASGYERREDEYERAAGVGGTGVGGAGLAAPAVATEGVATVPVAASETVQVARQGAEEVCGREYFTKVEDRPIIKERVTRVREHRPVELEYVVETKAVGERETGERIQESMGAEVREIERAQPVVEQPTAEYFTKVEDRPIMKERVTRMKEHVPVERQFVVETKAVGEKETGQRVEEHMGATERVVEVAQPKAPCE